MTCKFCGADPSKHIEHEPSCIALKGDYEKVFETKGVMKPLFIVCLSVIVSSWFATSMVTGVTSEMKKVSKSQERVSKVLDEGFKAYQESVQEFVDEVGDGVGLIDDYVQATYHRLEKLERLWLIQFPASTSDYNLKHMLYKAVAQQKDMLNIMEVVDERIKRLERHAESSSSP